jgi:hypothetical protein
MNKVIRIPVFENQFLFNVRNELKVDRDEPDFRWIDQNWRPEIDSNIIGNLYDSIAEKEIFRLLQFETCAFCREKMEKITPLGDKGIVYVCKNCFYWGGRGTRPGGPTFTRANLGRVNFINNPDEVQLELLISHLNRNINKIYDLSPRQAEKLLPNILKDYLDCEVKTFGGTRDKGIDAMALKGATEKIIIQIKWRDKK